MHTYVDTLLRDMDTENVSELSSLMAYWLLWKRLSRIRVPRNPACVEISLYLIQHDCTQNNLLYISHNYVLKPPP